MGRPTKGRNNKVSWKNTREVAIANLTMRVGREGKFSSDLHVEHTALGARGIRWRILYVSVKSGSGKICSIVTP